MIYSQLSNIKDLKSLNASQTISLLSGCGTSGSRLFVCYCHSTPLFPAPHHSLGISIRKDEWVIKSSQELLSSFKAQTHNSQQVMVGSNPTTGRPRVVSCINPCWHHTTMTRCTINKPDKYKCEACGMNFRLKLALQSHRVDCNSFAVTTKNNSSRQRRGKYIGGKVY